MPAFRRRAHCIGYMQDPLPKKPRVKKVLTDSEKEEAAMKREINKILKEKKKEWEGTLKVWRGDESTRLPMNTLAMYKSDAMKAFSLTELDMQTLKHESIANSPKSFYPLDLVQDLARRKYRVGALLSDPVDEAMLHARVWKKWQDNGRRNRTNWRELDEIFVPGSRLNRMLEASGRAKAQVAGKMS